MGNCREKSSTVNRKEVKQDRNSNRQRIKTLRAGRITDMIFNRGGDNSKNNSSPRISNGVSNARLGNSASLSNRSRTAAAASQKRLGSSNKKSPEINSLGLQNLHSRRNGGRVSRGVNTQSSNFYHNKSSQPSISRKLPTSAHLSNNDGTPIGLNGPTQFQFSPGSSNNVLEQRYLSFLSCHTPMIYHNNNSSVSGSPVRSMGVSAGGSNSSNSSSNEKRLCVMDLKPFYKTIDLMEEQKKKEQKQRNLQNQKKKNGSPTSQIQSMQIDDDNDEENKTLMIEPITDPNLVMNDHVSRLLNTSLPLNRRNDGISDSSSPTTSPTANSRATSPVAIDGNNFGRSNEKMSLEERLRRERQRLHSNGVTQFVWTSMKQDIFGSTASKSTPSYNREEFETNITHRSYPEQTNSFSLGQRNNVTFNRIKKKKPSDDDNVIRILVPLRGNIYIQDGVGQNVTSPLRLLYDKTMLEDYIKYTNTTSEHKGAKKKSRKGKKKNAANSIVGRDAGAIDPQLSPDGTMVAFVVAGEIYVMSCGDSFHQEMNQSEDDGRNEFDDARRVSSLHKMLLDTDEKIEDTPKLTDLSERRKPKRVTFGAVINDSGRCSQEYDGSSSSSEDEDDVMDESQLSRKRRYGRSITHGLADFVAQEEMDRYRGFWWDEKSNGILFVRVDESCVPPYRITHQGKDGIAGDEANYEEHRYPFAGENNPEVSLGYIPIDRGLILLGKQNDEEKDISDSRDEYNDSEVDDNRLGIEDFSSKEMWSQVKWFDPPQEASEYLARVNWLPCGSACIQWQDRRQSKLILCKIDIETGESTILHREYSDVWINLHHMFHVLPCTIHPNDCLRQDQKDTTFKALPKGSFSFLFASERTGYCHLYLYTYIPGDSEATLLRAISNGEWIVESIVGVDVDNDAVYVTGTYDSPLERHLYMLPLKGTPLTNSAEGAGIGVRRGFKQVLNTFTSSVKKQNFCSYEYSSPVNTEAPPDPIRLTKESGMHSIVMAKNCRIFVDTSSDLTRPPSSKIYSITGGHSGETYLLCVLYDASEDLKNDSTPFTSPELMSFTTSDGTETLHAALYSPDPMVHGAGPYPLICAVYGGPHVQRVNRSWNQSIDMRAQRLCSLGFAVAKCDNRGSSRRGLAFEAAIKNNLGRLEVLDQVALVRNLVMKRVADSSNVAIYGWSYGGYLSAMCLCRAPDVFKVAIAGAPVTSWDGYDTHYTERYMGLPKENASGYHEAAVFNHIQNMRGKLMIIHGLIDENVHFRHTARLINRLVSAGKNYDLLIFPDERHSPRRLRDRVYMEKRMNEYFITHLLRDSSNNHDEFLLGHL